MNQLNHLTNRTQNVSFDRVILIANLTRDPELRQTSGGTTVTKVVSAVNRAWKENKGKEAMFVDVTQWGLATEIASEHLSKALACPIAGRLQLDKWEDKRSGQSEKSAANR